MFMNIVVEQLESSASLYSKSIQGHHICLLVKLLVSIIVVVFVVVVVVVVVEVVVVVVLSCFLHHLHHFIDFSATDSCLLKAS